jgi:hypothetical protein
LNFASLYKFPFSVISWWVYAESKVQVTFLGHLFAWIFDVVPVVERRKKEERRVELFNKPSADFIEQPAVVVIVVVVAAELFKQQYSTIRGFCTVKS